MRFLEEELKKVSDARTFNDVQNIFRDIKPEQIRSSLKKLWLEDFYEFCTTQLNPTSVVMLDDLIKFEADIKSIQIVYNSIGNKVQINLFRNLTQLLRLVKQETNFAHLLVTFIQIQKKLFFKQQLMKTLKKL